ncbi:MAG: fibronectin type III domain-containing protein [Saprospiraceae bacterium]|nr:fibronectin type III domain-containing protein [Saprospiraceae bacterium]
MLPTNLKSAPNAATVNQPGRNTYLSKRPLSAAEREAVTTGGGTTGACTTPVNLEVSEVTTTSVKLSWSPVAGALRYEVEVEDDENTPAFSFDALTANTAVMIIGLTPGGKYQFKVKSKCGGGQSSEYSAWVLFSTALQLAAPATGLAGLGYENPMPAFQVYPNPAASAVTVQWNEPTTEIRSLSIVNAQGCQMMRYNNIDGANGRVELPVSNLDAGLYMVVVSNGRTTQSKQLVIVK